MITEAQHQFMVHDNSISIIKISQHHQPKWQEYFLGRFLKLFVSTKCNPSFLFILRVTLEQRIPCWDFRISIKTVCLLLICWFYPFNMKTHRTVKCLKKPHVASIYPVIALFSKGEQVACIPSKIYTGNGAFVPDASQSYHSQVYKRFLHELRTSPWKLINIYNESYMTSQQDISFAQQDQVRRSIASRNW